MNRVKIILMILSVCVALSYSAENIVNFRSVITAGSFLEVGDTLWVATSGGLVAHDLRGGGNSLISNAKIFPDLHLTALCRDRSGNMWIGSQKGYLYRRTPRGQFSVYSNYKTSEWSVTSLYTYGNLIVVGADKGVSLFDPERGVVVRNGVSIADFSNVRVNVISANGDTLFLGCDEGIAYLDSLNVVPLSQRNFYYPGIWKTKKAPDVPVPVVSFSDNGSAVIPDSVPSVIFRGYRLTADGGRIMYDGQPLTTVASSPGRILTMYNEGDRRLWIGTDEQFYSSYDGETAPRRHEVEGLALRSGSRIAVAGDGNVWVLPRLVYLTASWHHGVYRYDGRTWHRYNGYTHGDDFAYMGDNEAPTIAFGRDGTAWVGTWGGNIKRINPSSNSATQLVVGNRYFSEIGYYQGWKEWGKVDALAVDSTGYLWAYVWDNYFGNIFCHDPRISPNSSESDPVRAGYRWFIIDNNEPYKMESSMMELNVDIDNRIFVYDGSYNRFTIFRHGGNPLRDSIRIDTTYTGFGAVVAMVCAPDGTTYIAGDGMVRKVGRGSNKAEIVVSNVLGLSSLAVQGNVLWLGSMTNGVLRYPLDSLDDGGRRWIGEADGLPSDNVTSLALDDKNGYLWILTENAVSRLDIGRTEPVARSEPMQAFPNVFSLGRNTQGARHVTFTRLEPRSIVSVYAVNGALVAKVNAERFTEREWRAAWTPRRNLAPGTYFAVATPSGKRTKLILTP